MGGLFSSAPVPELKPPPNPLTDYPWRKLADWNAKLEVKLKEEIKNINPREKKSNLLISGPIGSGKSSFVNSVFSIGEGRKVFRAYTTTSASASTTVQYTGYTGGLLLNNYVLRDTMGIDPSNGKGFHVDDFICLVKGHVQNTYKFNPAGAISQGDEGFRENPLPEDKIHCVIFIFSAVEIDAGISSGKIRKIRQLQEKLQLEDIPRVLILTKADLLCEQVKEDISSMFRSKKIQEVVKRANEIFSIEQASIHPVVNYEDDYTLTPEGNIPLLLALRQCKHYAYDRLEQLRDAAELR